MIQIDNDVLGKARGITLPTSICCTACLQLALFDPIHSYHKQGGTFSPKRRCSSPPLVNQCVVSESRHYETGRFDMLDFPIDPELRIRGRPELVLQRTNEALNFVRRTAASMSSRAWQDVLARFEAIQDECSAIEAVVHLELQLGSEGRLIEEKQREPFRPVDKKHLTPTEPRFGR